MKNILFVHYGDNWIRGSEVCLLNLVKNLSSDFNPFIWTNNSALYSECNHLNIPARFYSFSIAFSWQEKKFKPFSWYEQLQHALTLIDNKQIDCIHINSAAPCQWVTLAARIKGIPHLCQLHCHYNLHDRLSLGLNLVPNLVTVSKAVSHGLNQDGYPKENLNIIYNGVPETTASKLNLKQILGIPSDAKVLISVGSLIHRKGFDRIIETLSKLTHNCHLVIIGEGPERAKLKGLTVRLDVAQQVHFVGEVNNVSDYLAEADLFISGARSEAFGLVLVEAFWQHLPVIASNVGGIPEVVEHGISGLLFETEQELIECIDRVLGSQALYQTLATHGYQRAQQRFSIQTNTQALEEQYHSIMRSQTKPSWLSLMSPLKTLFSTRVLKGGNYEAR
ncbi:glycosyltransferase sypI [Vibrio ishigakensis]|uniref:Glycosyltransferase sypI n=1 Tax=Vibrio ishigakensis TaxID=1481914 RepID=A0A0B8Q3N8_9VIBR|nr:glycosyltransferase sypI [Vibrio ishigakensis]